jgi:hypothetical protein
MVGEYVMRHFLLPNAGLPLVVAETEAGSTHLRLHGRAGSQVVLESSDDLGGWRDVVTNSATMGGIAIPLEVAGPARFFRVREQ